MLAAITAAVMLSALSASVVEASTAQERESASPAHDSGHETVLVLDQDFKTVKLGGSTSKSQTKQASEHSTTLSDAEARDLASLAEEEGSTVDELSERFYGGQEFTAFVTWLSDEYPDYYTHSAFASDNLERPRVTLTEYPPAPVIERARQLPIEIDLRYGANASEDELMTLSSTAVKTALAVFGEESAPRSSIDEESISIKVVSRGSVQDTKTVHALQNRVANQTSGSRGILPVQVDFVSDPNHEPVMPFAANIRGGYKLTFSGSSVPQCTTGFSVKRNGVKGIVTAGHCPNAVRYKELSNAIQFVIEYPFWTVTQDVDVQFHKTLGSNNTQKKFRADTGDVRTVTNSKVPSIGLPICKYGMTTGKKCTTVADTGQCGPLAGVAHKTFCRLAVTSTAFSDFGDSGGPSYYGNIAYGTVSGGDEHYTFSVFTSIKAVTSELGATVLK